MSSKQEVVESNYKINAKIVNREVGLTEYEGIRMIRIKSIDHNLLIMEDYMPVIGEITGYVEFVFKEKSIPYENVHGFYMHKQNEFYLLIDN